MKKLFFGGIHPKYNKEMSTGIHSSISILVRTDYTFMVAFITQRNICHFITTLILQGEVPYLRHPK